MKIARVFPRKTSGSPDDDLAFFDAPGLFPPQVDEVHVSMAFTYDIQRAEYLAKCWQHIAPVKIGGPAFGEPSGDFVPGRYMKHGYVITSRGCPNKCWFCSVWKREPKVKELPITDGWKLQDDNLLACSKDHIRAVFEMLKKYRGKVEFTGGIEARLLKPWHAALMREVRAKQVFMAYDTPDDWEPLVEAAKIFFDAGFTVGSHALRAYVLIGHPKDTIDRAERRLKDTLALGIIPMAMLWRGETGEPVSKWKRFQRTWARPAIIAISN